MVDPDRTPSSAKAIAGLVIGLFTAVILASITAGYLAGMEEHGHGFIAPWLGAVVVSAVITSITVAMTARSFPSWRSLSPRRQRYWASLGGSGLVGGIVGVMFVVSGEQEQNSMALFGNGFIQPNIAIAASLLWLFGVGIACIVYHRAIDDHEERAWLWAGLAGWYAFVLPAPVWWVLHRAALIPPVDAMLLFLFSLSVNAIVWLWLKFR